jgi:hypothetical protein
MGSNADHYNYSLTAIRQEAREDQQITSYSAYLPRCYCNMQS